MYACMYVYIYIYMYKVSSPSKAQSEARVFRFASAEWHSPGKAQAGDVKTWLE